MSYRNFIALQAQYAAVKANRPREELSGAGLLLCYFKRPCDQLDLRRLKPNVTLIATKVSARMNM